MARFGTPPLGRGEALGKRRGGSKPTKRGDGGPIRRVLFYTRVNALDESLISGKWHHMEGKPAPGNGTQLRKQVPEYSRKCKKTENFSIFGIYANVRVNINAHGTPGFTPVVCLALWDPVV